MINKEKMWDVPFHEAFFKTSHNSYELSIRKQLDKGVRGLEYDIHDDKIQELGDFEVYHLQNNIDVLLGKDGNPDDYLFSNWLQVLSDWSNEQNKVQKILLKILSSKD